MSVQALAGTSVEQMSGSIEGISQVTRVPALSLTAQPKYVLCGGDVPCPEITPKTLNILPQVPVISEPPAAQKPTKKEPVSTTVHFAFGRHELNHAARNAISSLLRTAKVSGDDFIVTIDGYTDSIGTKAFNDRLALKRAMAVKKHLISAGLPAERVRIGKTVGKCCYVMPNETKAGRAANRRAEVVSLSVTFD